MFECFIRLKYNVYPRFGDASTCRCIRDKLGQGVVFFSMLINFGQSSSTETRTSKFKSVVVTSNCTTTEWIAPDGRCLPLKCTPGKVLVSETCRSAIPEINGLQYDLKLRLQPIFVKENRTLSELGQDLLQELIKIVSKISHKHMLESGCLYYNTTDHMTPLTDHKVMCWVSGMIVASRTMPRDTFERNLINDLISGQVDVELDRDSKFSFQTMVIMDEMEYCQDIILRSRDGLICEFSYLANDLFDSVPNTRPIKVTGLLDCPYVSIGPSFYNITINKSDLIPSVTVTVDFNVTTLTISNWDDLNRLQVDEADILNVCHEVFDSKIQPVRRHRLLYVPEVTSEADVTKYVQYVMTLVCLTCSMVCLVLSLVTYLRFPVLQTSAGKNNICLCLSLLLAQAALIAAAYRPQPLALCQAVGLMTHFLWLWMFSWTFICSFHMFRVFTAKTRVTTCSGRDERNQFIKRVVGSLLCPVFIVLSVVVGSLISSDGANIGYGLDACYLDSVLLIGVAMVAPLTAIIICNMAFFTVTVWTVRNIRALQSRDGARRDDVNQLFVYVKLSSITGACWATTIIAEAANVEAFRFMSILLNGFQGVFIFLSYICNKRVLNLYLPLMGQLNRSSTSANSTSITQCTISTRVAVPEQLKVPQATDYGSQKIKLKDVAYH